jgi:hypothetical protein
MSYLGLIKVATPSTPSANQVTLYSDTNDNNRIKAIHDSGAIDILTENNRYNYLINGGMDFLQRFPVALTTNTQSLLGRQMNLDQWGLTSFVASGQAGRIDALVTPIVGSVSRYYAQYKQITNPGKLAISQVLEFKDISNLRGKTVRFQIKIATGTWASGSALRMGMVQNNVSATADTIAASFYSAQGANSTDPTLGTNLVLVAPTLVESSAVTQPTIVNNALLIANPGANLTFTRYSGVFLVPTNCVNLIFVVWTDSLLTANDVLNLAEASVVLGQEIQDWNPQSNAVELFRCQRYYEKTFGIDTAPVQNAGVHTGEALCTKVVAGATAGRFNNQTMKATKRIPIVTGNVTFYSPGSAAAQVWDETASVVDTATTFVAGSDSSFGITYTGNASTAAEGLQGVHWSVDQAI